MKRYLAILWLSLLTLCASVQANTAIDELLAALQNIEQLQGRFKQLQYAESDVLLVESSGTFRLLRPDWQLALQTEIVQARVTVQGLHVAKVTDGLVRLSVGLEDEGDLIGDCVSHVFSMKGEQKTYSMSELRRFLKNVVDVDEADAAHGVLLAYGCFTG